MSAPQGRPVVFGEVLFDRFPDGSAVLGGAPFNVAWHLQGFAATPLFISRVGDDHAGRQVFEAMHAWGMDAAGVQIDTVHPTGAVEVVLVDGQPTYTIVPDQAYDFIDADGAATAVAHTDAGLLYYGTLAARNPASETAMARLRNDTSLQTFVDINLRAPWWDIPRVETALQGARWAKLNDEELAQVLGREAGTLDIVAAAREVRERYQLKYLVVTRGSAGALLVTADEVVHGRPAEVADIVDTVGAGDGFSAVMIVGLLQGWPLAATLERALEFAAAICAVRGATTADPGLYARHLARWQSPGEKGDAD